jgi:hypothetical protein
LRRATHPSRFATFCSNSTSLCSTSLCSNMVMTGKVRIFDQNLPNAQHPWKPICWETREWCMVHDM